MRYLSEDKRLEQVGQYAHSVNPAVSNIISQEEITISKEDAKAELAIESVEQEIITTEILAEENNEEAIEINVIGTDQNELNELDLASIMQ